MQSIRSKPWKITEQQFLDRYGKDDSSRTLIRYYFERRRTAKKASLWYSGGAGVFGLVVPLASNGGGKDPDGEALLFLIAGLCLFAIVATVAIIKWISRSKKYLFKLIERYQQGKQVPKKISTQQRFQDLLKEEHAK